MINWYNEVSRNLDKIPDCIAYFEKELLEAKKQCKIYGNLERASAALPGVVEKMRQWEVQGCRMILITGRRESERERTEKELKHFHIFLWKFH